MSPGAKPLGGRIRELVEYFLRLGLIGFGGPVALVGQIERELVGERGWLTKARMREAIAICQSLPGPLAIQVGIYIPTCAVASGGVGGRLGLHFYGTLLDTLGWAKIIPTRWCRGVWTSRRKR